MVNPRNGNVYAVALVLAIGLTVLLAIVNPPHLIIILNGVFAGAAFAIATAYSPLVWYTLRGDSPYDRVRQMTLGFVCCWVAYGIGVMVSIYYRSTGEMIPASMWTATGRYLAIIAAVLQVTAPDFGLGIFHGRDRKVLWSGATLGLVVAVIAIYIQINETLAGLIPW